MELKHAPDVFEKRERFGADVKTAKVALGQAEAIAKTALSIEDIDSAIAGGAAALDAESRLLAST